MIFRLESRKRGYATSSCRVSMQSLPRYPPHHPRLSVTVQATSHNCGLPQHAQDTNPVLQSELGTSVATVVTTVTFVPTSALTEHW